MVRLPRAYYFLYYYFISKIFLLLGALEKRVKVGNQLTTCWDPLGWQELILVRQVVRQTFPLTTFQGWFWLGKMACLTTP